METDQILLKQFIEQHPTQAVQILETLGDEQVSALIDEIPVELAIQLISSMHIDKSARCVKNIDNKLAVELLEKSSDTVAVALLRRADEEFRRDMINLLSAERATLLRKKLDYPIDTIGTIMHPFHLALRTDMSIDDALKLLKNNQDKIIGSIYVIDGENKLVGAVLLNKLLFGKGTDRISSIMEKEFPKVDAERSILSIKNHPGWQKYRSIPVVELSEKLVGVLHFEDVHVTQTRGSDEKTRHVLETTSALGELYRIGLQGLLHSISEIKS